MINYYKEFSKFDSESLAYIINKYAWRTQDEILRELKFMRWDKESKKDLELRKKENEELTKLARKKRSMSKNTDKELLAYLKADKKYWDKVNLYHNRQKERDEKLKELYKDIDNTFTESL